MATSGYYVRHAKSPRLEDLKKFLQFGAVVAMGAADDDRQRDAMLVDQQVTLAPFFFPDPSDWVRPTRGPGVP